MKPAKSLATIVAFMLLTCSCRDEGQAFADAACACKDLPCVMNVYREFETKFPELKSTLAETEKLPEAKKKHLQRVAECVDKLNKK